MSNTLKPLTHLAHNNSDQKQYFAEAHVQGIQGALTSDGSSWVIPGPVAPVPEPSTFILLGVGLLGAGLMRRRISK